jgi:hypothetical protein
MKKNLLAGAIGAAAVAAAVSLAPSANAALFTICPSGVSGVMGGHTSCAFADVIHSGYYRHGNHFSAFSPATGQWYDVDCSEHGATTFTNGHVHYGAHCYAGNNAEAVVW